MDAASISKKSLAAMDARAPLERSAKARTFALEDRPAPAYYRPQHRIFVLSPTDCPLSEGGARA